jgi:hypothetical protein
MTRVLISGYYGFGNAGDEAILTALLSELRAALPDAGVTVVSGSPRETELEHEVTAVHWQDMPAIVAAARDADRMVLGGGGLFQDYWGVHPDNLLTARHGSIDNWTGFALLATLSSTPLMIHGVGIGPVTSEAGIEYTRLAFDQAAVATVRDEASREVLAAAGLEDRIELTADPAFLLTPVPADVIEPLLAADGVAPSDTLRVAVALRPWLEGPRGWQDDVARGLDALVERTGCDILFVPFQRSLAPRENDARVATEVAGRMRHVRHTTILRSDYRPAELLAVLGTCGLVVGMRLHAGIFAAHQGVPLVALSYDPKVTALMDALGISDFNVSLDRSSSLPDLGSEALARATELRELLLRGAETMRERANAGSTTLSEFLTGSPAAPQANPETRRAIDRLALNRVVGEGTKDLEAKALQARLRTVETELLNATKAYDGLASQHAEILDSRTFSVVSAYWGARTKMRDLGGMVRRGLDRAAPRMVPVRYRTKMRDLGLSHDDEPAYSPEQMAELRERFTVELDDLLEQHTDAPGVVVFPPGIGWGVTLFQRPQQMALAFARLGYLVLYHLRHDNAEQVLGFRSYAPHLYLGHVPESVLDVERRIPDPLLITYVYNFDWRRHLADPLVVYEHIDELEVFTAAYPMSDLRGWHERATHNADLVVGSARDLYEQVAAVRPDAVLCPNGVDYDHFASYRPDGSTPDGLENLVAAGRPIIGYYGAIAKWLDYDLIDAAAGALPDYQFVFIGPDYDGSVDGSTAFERPNVHWLGPRSYQDLPAYLHWFDVATIPFEVSDVTHGVSPLKLFEYMAGGRPIVTPNLRECRRYPEVLIADGRDEWIARLQEAAALRRDHDYERRLRRAARNNTWERRALTLIDAAARTRVDR